jgi:hypothetical protein
LEALPRGILHKIFDLACDLNLLKASSFLELWLRHAPVYKRLLAFTSDDFDRSQRPPRDFQSKAPSEPEKHACRSIILDGLPKIPLEKRKIMQNDVLARPWFAWQFLQRVKRYYI